MPIPDSNSVRRLAARRWAHICRESPDLSTPVFLQQRLVSIAIEASGSLIASGTLSLTPAALREKFERGLPALRNVEIVVPPQLVDTIGPICTVLAEGGAGDPARHIADAITNHQLDATSLLKVSVARNQKAIRTSALHMGFSADLLWLVGELASAPLAHHLHGGVPMRTAAWNRGYCPFCGSWPAFIELSGQSRSLRCSYCALAWSLWRHRCVYCGESGDALVSAAPDVNKPGLHVDLCTKCAGYTKVITVEEPTPFPLLAIEDLATTELDREAMRREYRRPPLLDLDELDPPASADCT